MSPRSDVSVSAHHGGDGRGERRGGDHRDHGARACAIETRVLGHGAREGISERRGERDPLQACRESSSARKHRENGFDWTHSRSRVIRIGTRHLPREKSAAVHVQTYKIRVWAGIWALTGSISWASRARGTRPRRTPRGGSS
eukprot:31125-Pelagococcus_subviridis.AAC.23